MCRQTKEIKTHSLVLQAPEVGTYSNIVTRALAVALEKFLLDFADPEEATDDSWYYDPLKEILYDSDGETNIGAFLTWEETRGFIQDPIGQFNNYYEATAQLFELIIELNKENINLLYESVNSREVDVIIYGNVIVLHIRGTSA
jgi:hypothetical protein